MGLADDLATRLAYESLSSLSGMASKVQETIEHNRRAFANQVALIDRQVMQKALFAWRTWRAGKTTKRDKLRRAMNRILRGTLSRGFYCWRDHLRENDKGRLMQRKVRSGCHQEGLKCARWGPDGGPAQSIPSWFPCGSKLQ